MLHATIENKIEFNAQKCIEKFNNSWKQQIMEFIKNLLMLRHRNNE